MVGAIADWFAVTALFRHPLGLPIPHTALVPRKKDEFGKSLEEFFAENFLHEEVIRERLAAADISRRLGSLARRAGQRTPGGGRGGDRDRDRAAQAAQGGRRLARGGSADPALHGRADGPGGRWPAAGDRRGQRPPRPGRARAGGGAPLAGAQPADLLRRGRRAGAVVGAGSAQRAGHRAAAPRGGPLAGRHPARPPAPRPRGPGQPAAPAGPRPAPRRSDPGARREAQDAGARAAADGRPPACRCGARSARRCSRPSRTRTGRCASAPPGSWPPSGRPSAATTPSAASWTRGPPTSPSGRWAATAASSPPSSRRRSSGGTARRRPRRSSCTSAATCSSSGSTAPWSAAWSGWSSTRVSLAI